jgi:hypothetical protein
MWASVNLFVDCLWIICVLCVFMFKCHSAGGKPQPVGPVLHRAIPAGQLGALPVVSLWAELPLGIHMHACGGMAHADSCTALVSQWTRLPLGIHMHTWRPVACASWHMREGATQLLVHHDAMHILPTANGCATPSWHGSNCSPAVDPCACCSSYCLCQPLGMGQAALQL